MSYFWDRVKPGSYKTYGRNPRFTIERITTGSKTAWTVTENVYEETAGGRGVLVLARSLTLGTYNTLDQAKAAAQRVMDNEVNLRRAAEREESRIRREEQQAKAEAEKQERLAKDSHRDHNVHLWLTIDRDTAIALIADLSREVVEGREITVKVNTARSWTDDNYKHHEDENRANISVSDWRQHNVPVTDSLVEPRKQPATPEIEDADSFAAAV